jgi:hypothetical protein
LPLALVEDKFLLNIDLCLLHVLWIIYMCPEPHATGLAYPKEQSIVGRFYYSHSACGDHTPCFLENLPLALVQGEFDPQILIGGLRVFEEMLRSKKL